MNRARPTMAGIGALVVIACASYAVFAVRGEPFGTINDFVNGVVGAATGILAWQVRRLNADGRGMSPVVTTICLAGAVVAVAGSALTISKTTGFLFAAFVSTVGFALLGVWLIEYNRSLRMLRLASRRLTTFGIATGAVMAFGFTHLPAALFRFDGFNTAPAWTWIGFAAWAGTYFLLPAWCFWAVMTFSQPPGSRIIRGNSASRVLLLVRRGLGRLQIS